MKKLEVGYFANLIGDPLDEQLGHFVEIMSFRKILSITPRKDHEDLVELEGIDGELSVHWLNEIVAQKPPIKL